MLCDYLPSLPWKEIYIGWKVRPTLFYEAEHQATKKQWESYHYAGIGELPRDHGIPFQQDG